MTKLGRSPEASETETLSGTRLFIVSEKLTGIST
jgi:hypothetical protein